MKIDISIILAGIAFLEATVSMILQITSKNHLKKMEQKHEKELLQIKQDHETKMLELQNSDKQHEQFEICRYNAITNYLSSAGYYLSNSYSNEAYASFTQSISQIFMYLPKEKHDKIKELNEKIVLVHTIRNTSEDDSYARGELASQRAEAFRLCLCEEFKDFGIKHPQSR